MMMTSRRPRGGPIAFRGSRRFGFGLLLYLILAVVVFGFIGRSMPHLAHRVGHIRHGWLRFSIYFLIYIGIALGSAWGIQHFQARLRRENTLRIAFTAATTLSLAVAVYQNRFGAGLSATYFTVGTLGAFVGMLLVTHMVFGLVEVNALPSREMIMDVLRGHQGLALADGGWDRVKRVIELIIALMTITLSLPISILLIVVIWLQDPGPLFVAKVAVTRGGRSFHQFKLRSMIKNAEDATGAVPAAPDDRRITRVGYVLRRTHIDELPQMLNIVWGDMSLVGPRPDRTVFARRNLHTLPRYPLRHVVRPGLAGFAQVFGDYYSTPREKLRYDLLYIRHRSFGLDLRLFATATLLALTGVAPGMNRGRRQFRMRREEERWRDAYNALHGETALSGSAGNSSPDTSVAGADPVQ